MNSIRNQILTYLQSPEYRPLKPRQLARELSLHADPEYGQFKQALRDLEEEGVVEQAGGALRLAAAELKKGEVIGIYSGSKRGFGFINVQNPSPHPQLFVPEEHNTLRAVSGDVVKARVMRREGREPGDLDAGRIVAIQKRAHSRIAGTLQKNDGAWCVVPDGNVFTDVIFTPDAAGKYLKVGTKVIVDITTYPAEYEAGQGVVSEVLGQRGEKDVDLKTVLVQFNLPEDFPEDVKEQARAAVDRFDPELERTRRLDLTGEVICTIDPDDAKDYDDAIGLKRDGDGNWELGVHIADVSFFVTEGSPLDVEAQHRGNSTYFPGHVVPMLPEVLSNGVCSLQADVPRLVKSAFITIDAADGKPLRTRFSNSIIKSAKRLRYREAQALIDGAATFPHPDGDKKRSDYSEPVLKLLADMNTVSRLMQARRRRAGQLVLELPKVDLVLDAEGKVVDAIPEDDSFTHTLIEMFMVEANEAVARLFHRLDLPAIRRTHPDPDPDATARLTKFVMVAGHKLPEEADRKALQQLLEKVRGKPESFAVNMASLKSMARAEYSPEEIGHYALASDHYVHFTSPIRRYADLTVHRLLDAIFAAIGESGQHGRLNPSANLDLDESSHPSFNQLVVLGQHLCFTERKSDEAERELRQVKLLELLEKQIGKEFGGVVTGITKFGLFIQLEKWLCEGLVRYPQLLNDFWQLDEKAGVVRGQRTGQRIHVGDVARVRIARVDVPRRELDVTVLKITSRGTQGAPLEDAPSSKKHGKRGEQQNTAPGKKRIPKAGTERRSIKSKSRDKAKGPRRPK